MRVRGAITAIGGAIAILIRHEEDRIPSVLLVFIRILSNSASFQTGKSNSRYFGRGQRSSAIASSSESEA